MGSSPVQEINVRTASSACRRDGRHRSSAPPSRDVHCCAVKRLSIAIPCALTSLGPHIGCNRRAKGSGIFWEPFCPGFI